MHKFILAVALLVGGGALAATPTQAVSAASGFSQTDALNRGRALALQFYALKVVPLWTAFTPDMQAQWGSLEQFTAYRQAGLTEYGEETSVLDETVVQQGDLEVYVRTAVFARHPQEAWSVIMGFDSSGRVAFFTIALQGDAPQGTRST